MTVLKCNILLQYPILLVFRQNTECQIIEMVQINFIVGLCTCTHSSSISQVAIHIN